jgi:hypothetical protein
MESELNTNPKDKLTESNLSDPAGTPGRNIDVVN